MSKKKENPESIDNIIENTFSHIKDIVDANTVVGSVINIDKDTFVIPVSKISVGLISGGGAIPKSKSKDMGAGSGTGFNIVPIGFITISKGVINFLRVNEEMVEKNLVDIAFKFYEILAAKKDNGYEE